MLVCGVLEVMLGGVIYATDDPAKLYVLMAVELGIFFIILLALRATLRA